MTARSRSFLRMWRLTASFCAIWQRVLPFLCRLCGILTFSSAYTMIS